MRCTVLTPTPYVAAMTGNAWRMLSPQRGLDRGLDVGTDLGPAEPLSSLLARRPARTRS